MPSISIVIPCYRSQGTLPELIDRIAIVMSRLEFPFEVILVNDASPDNTWSVICRLAEKNAFIYGIDLQINCGQARATMCGLEHASGELIVIMDDDLQHPPEELPKLIGAIAADPAVDCVMGRFEAKQHSWWRNIGSRLVSWMNHRLYNKPKHISPSSFRVLRREIARTICMHSTVNPVIGPLIYRCTNRIVNVTVEHHPRKAGRSGHGLGALVTIVMDNYLSASTLPLRAISFFGALSALASLCLITWYLIMYLIHQIVVPGFMTQIMLVLFFGGSTLFSIGLIGEYLIRIMDEVRRSPRFLVRGCVGHRQLLVGRADMGPDST